MDTTQRHREERMRRDLEPARRRVRRARFRCALPAAVDVLLVGIILVLALHCLIFRSTVVLAAGVCVTLLAAAATAMVQLLRHPVDHGEAAARLDAASNAHNLIATAWCLAERETASPFAAAAIDQGMTVLAAARDRCPSLPEVSPGFRRKAALVGLLAVAAVLPLWRPSERALSDQNTVSPSAESRSPGESIASRPVAMTLPERDQAVTGQHEARRLPPAAATAGSPSLPQGGAPRSQLSRSIASGQSGASRRIRSEPASRTGSQEGESSPGAAEKREPRGGNARAGAAGAESRRAQEAASSASIVGAGSGAGQTLAVANRSSTRDPGNQEDQDGDESEQKLEEQARGSQQRGGLQPSLPDRTAAPSRELGITGPQSGRPGTGRGGPSPAKKSRGVASLLMGVALPDFVRGKTGPGPAAVALEDTEPVPSPEPLSPAVPVRPRSLDESPIGREEIRWADAPILRRYLVGWHSLDHAPSNVDSGTAANDRHSAPTLKAGTP